MKNTWVLKLKNETVIIYVPIIINCDHKPENSIFHDFVK